MGAENFDFASPRLLRNEIPVANFVVLDKNSPTRGKFFDWIKFRREGASGP